MSDGGYNERRSSSERFLPPDPRVREPHRLTPAARAESRRARRRRAARVRRALPPTLVAAGALRRRVPERGAEQPAPPRPGRGAARADPRSPGPCHRLERRGHRRPALDRRHAEGGPVRARQRLARVLNVPAKALAREVEERPRRSADADHREDLGRRGAGQLPLRASGRVPGSRDRSDLPARLRVQHPRRSDPRLRRRDLAGGAQAASTRRLPRGRPDRQGGHRGGVRHVSPRRGRPRPDPRRLARPNQ